MSMLELVNDNLGQTLLAVGALGTAAYGLVDTSKAMWGGVSNAGFRHVVAGLRPYAAALDLATGGAWPRMLRAHWLNGRGKEDQKAIARALIRLGLAETTAADAAAAARVDPAALTAVTIKLAKGVSLTEQDLNLMGRFDVVLESQLDAAFERAEQSYRASARGLAAVAAVGLALVAMIAQQKRLLTSDEFGLAVFVGVLAVPLAPVAKDLASALNAAMQAVRGKT